jgi:hypothetical protein
MFLMTPAWDYSPAIAGKDEAKLHIVRCCGICDLRSESRLPSNTWPLHLINTVVLADYDL